MAFYLILTIFDLSLCFNLKFLFYFVVDICCSIVTLLFYLFMSITIYLLLISDNLITSHFTLSIFISSLCSWSSIIIVLTLQVARTNFVFLQPDLTRHSLFVTIFFRYSRRVSKRPGLASFLKFVKGNKINKSKEY